MGDMCEDIVRKLFKKYSIKLKPTQPSCYYDFEVKNLMVEVKGRNCSSKAYRETLIGSNKIEHYLNRPNSELYKFLLVFVFTDGIFAHFYDRNYPYSTCDSPITSYRKMHHLIPVDRLKPIRQILSELKPEYRGDQKKTYRDL